MRLIVTSDSHGRTNLLGQAISSVETDGIVHLGDHYKDIERLHPDIPVYAVGGNCDVGGEPERLIELEGKKIFMTHGHLYHVKSELQSLAHRAQSLGAHVALYGHTHIPGYEYFGRTLVLNPGAVCGSRLNGKCTFAVLEWKRGSEIYMQYREIRHD